MRLYLDRFREMAAAYPQVLIAQRTLFQTTGRYLSALEEAHRAADPDPGTPARGRPRGAARTGRGSDAESGPGSFPASSARASFRGGSPAGKELRQDSQGEIDEKDSSIRGDVMVALWAASSPSRQHDGPSNAGSERPRRQMQADSGDVARIRWRRSNGSIRRARKRSSDERSGEDASGDRRAAELAWGRSRANLLASTTARADVDDARLGMGRWTTRRCMTRAGSSEEPAPGKRGNGSHRRWMDMPGMNHPGKERRSKKQDAEDDSARKSPPPSGKTKDVDHSRWT